jgi:hypothetical protein
VTTIHSVYCLLGRILWTASTPHKAAEAISLVSNPLFSNVLTKRCCAASSSGAMIVVDTVACKNGFPFEELSTRFQSLAESVTAQRTPLKDQQHPTSTFETFALEQSCSTLHYEARIVKSYLFETHEISVSTRSYGSLLRASCQGIAYPWSAHLLYYSI